MLASKDLFKDPAVCSTEDKSAAPSEIHGLLDPDRIDTHTLLLLYLLPEINRSDIDPETVHAVEVLSEVQNRLCSDQEKAALDKDNLASLLGSISNIRFGIH